MQLSPATLDTVLTRIATAHTIALAAYVLHDGPMRTALIAAAHRGADVAVTLQRNPYHLGAKARDANRDTVTTLRAAGAHVTSLTRGRAPFHLKAAVCDDTAFLDDRNWTHGGNDVIVADTDPADVSLVRAAIGGTGGALGDIATRKGSAVALEARLIDDAGDAPVLVETEAYGNSPVSAALERHARRGAPTTLIVSPDEAHNRSELAALARLRAEGARVVESGTNQKLAVAGDEAWIGSANATFSAGPEADQVDWGMRTREPALVASARAMLQRDLAG